MRSATGWSGASEPLACASNVKRPGNAGPSWTPRVKRDDRSGMLRLCWRSLGQLAARAADAGAAVPAGAGRGAVAAGRHVVEVGVVVLLREELRVQHVVLHVGVAAAVDRRHAQLVGGVVGD